MRRTVTYYHHPDSGSFYFGRNHPMKPHCVTVAHDLINAYGLTKKMDVKVPNASPTGEMTSYHDEEYIKFLRRVTPDQPEQFATYMKKYALGGDCPVIDGALLLLFDWLCERRRRHRWCCWCWCCCCCGWRCCCWWWYCCCWSWCRCCYRCR